VRQLARILDGEPRGVFFTATLKRLDRYEQSRVLSARTLALESAHLSIAPTNRRGTDRRQLRHVTGGGVCKDERTVTQAYLKQGARGVQPNTACRKVAAVSGTLRILAISELRFSRLCRRRVPFSDAWLGERSLTTNRSPRSTSPTYTSSCVGTDFGVHTAYLVPAHGPSLPS